MKKLAAMLLTGVMAISLAACGGSTGASTNTDTAAQEAAPEADAAEAEAAPEADAAEAEADAAAEAPAADDTEFVVGFDAEYPPYGYLDMETNDYTGFDLELAQEVCNRRGWTLVKKPINWDNKDAEIDSGSIDCIWNGMTYTGREAEYTWSDPYVNNSIVIAVLADSEIQTAADLAGKIVITQSDSSALTALESEELAELRGTFADLQQNPSYNTCFQDMQAGAVDAIAVDIGVAQYQMRNNPDKFRILEEPISTEQYAIAFKLGNEALRDQVQETYDEMLADGTVMKIAQNYAEDNLPDMLITQK
ncbi:MAG TPA: ABC transporter substrate-binding protein [Lachnospiraceae bacterium]|nr:ABC transporter substrate-binding protein [Lachnospiraceae bacterium]